MVPELIRPAQLQIDKPVRRVPFHNFAGPAQRKSMQAKAICDDRALADGCRRHAENPEMQPGRREYLKAFSAREESKDFRLRAGHLLFENQSIRFARHLPVRALPSSIESQQTQLCRTASKPGVDGGGSLKRNNRQRSGG